MARGAAKRGALSWAARALAGVVCLAAAIGPRPMADAAEPVVLRGHAADVFMAAFTPDGGRVVTASADETARLWDAASAAELRRFVGHTGPVSCLAVSADGRTLVTGAQDNSVRVWGLPLPGPRVSLPACPPTGAAALVVLPDGRTAITAGGTKGIKLWRLDGLPGRPADPPPGPPVERAGHDAPVVTAAGSLDGNQVATVDETGRILLWSPLLDEPLGTVGIHGGGVAALAFRADGQRLLSAGRDGTLRAWTLPPPPARTAAAAATAVRDLVALPNQPMAIVVHDDAVRVVDTQSLAPAREWAKPAAAVGTVAVTPDGALAALGDSSGAVRLVQVADGADRGRVAGHDGALLDVAFLPDGKGFFTAGADGTLRRWMVPAPPLPLAGHAAAVQAVAGGASGQWFASGSADRTVRVWNPAGQTVRTLGPVAGAVTALAATPDDALVAAGDASGAIALWAAADGAPRGSLLAHRGEVRALAADRASPGFWSAGADGTLKRWKLPLVPPVALAGHSQPIRAAAASADGRVVVTGGQDQSVRLWDPTTGQSPRALGAQPAGAVAGVALSADGALVAAVSDSGSLRVWKSADGTPLLERAVPGGALFDVAFVGADRVATVGQDNVVRLWDTGAVAEAPIPPVGTPIQAAASSRDGLRHAVAGAFGGKPGVLLRDRNTGQSLGTFAGPEAPITLLSLSRDGAAVAAASGAAVFAWAAAGGEPTVLADLPAAVSALAIADDGRSCFLATGDGSIRHWSLAEKKELRQFAGHGAPVRHLLLDGGRLHSAGDDGNVITWDTGSGTQVRAVPTGAAIRTLDVSPAGRVAAASAARTIHLWSPADAAPPVVVPALPQEVTSLRWSADGRSLALASPDAVRILQADGIALDVLPAAGALACLWRPDAAKLIALGADGAATPLAPAAVHAVTAADPDTRVLAAAPAGGTLVASGAGRRLLVHAVEKGRFADSAVVAIAAGAARVVDLAFAADGAWLASAGEDGRIAVWAAAALPAAGAPRLTLTHGQPVRGVAVEGGERPHLAAAAADGVVVYDVASGKEAERWTEFPGQGVVVATPGGTWLTGGDDGTARRWTPALDRLVALGDTPADVVKSLVALPGEGGVVGITGAPGLRRWLPDGTPTATLAADMAPLLLAATPDGTRLAIADAGGAVRLLRSADGSLSGTVAAGPGLTSLAVAADGAQVIVGDGSPRLRAFAAEGGRLVEEMAIDQPAGLLLVTGTSGRQWAGFGGQPQGILRERSWMASWDSGGPAVEALAVSGDGGRLFAGRADGAIWQIAAGTGAVERTLAGSGAAVHELALEPAGTLLAAAGEDGVRLWSLADGTVARRIESAAPVRRAAFVGGKRLATADDRGLVELWQSDTGAPLESFSQAAAGPAVVRLASDGQTILSAGADGRLTAWRGGAVASIRVGAPLDGLVAAGGEQAVVADSSAAVRFVDVAANAVGRTLREGLPPPLSLALRPDGARLAIGAADGAVRIVNPGDGAEIVTLDAEGPVTALAWRGDGQRLAAATSAGGGAARISTFGPPAPGPTPARELERHDAVAVAAGVVRLGWDKDGRDVWALHADGALARWALAAPAALFKLDHGGPVLAVAVSRDGETIVSGGADQSVRVWDATTGQQRAQMTGHTGPVHALAFTPEEALVVSASADRTIRLWDVAGGRQLKQLATTEETAYAVAVHPAGQSVAVGGADRAVHLLNLVSGATERTLAGHGDFVHGVAFNPAGTTLLSYGYAGELRVWRLGTGVPLLDTRVGRIGNGAAFDAKGERIVVASGDGTASVIDVPPGARE